jgi:HAD superfamily hydrolase (TIGR01509 family)
VLVVKKIKAVILDLDGTLVEFKIDYLRARRDSIKALKEFDFLPNSLFSTDESIFSMCDKASAYLIKKGESQATLKKVKEAVMKIADKYEMEAVRKTRLLPKARETLEELRGRGLKLALFTTDGEKAMNHVLKKFKIKSYFECCASRETVSRVKPHPEHVEALFTLLNVKPDEAAVVGDSALDMLSAKSAGSIAIGVLTGIADLQQLKQAGADYIIATISELPDLLANLTAER